jgi:hypothetical protein
MSTVHPDERDHIADDWYARLVVAPSLLVLPEPVRERVASQLAHMLATGRVESSGPWADDMLVIDDPATIAEAGMRWRTGYETGLRHRVMREAIGDLGEVTVREDKGRRTSRIEIRYYDRVPAIVRDGRE